MSLNLYFSPKKSSNIKKTTKFLNDKLILSPITKNIASNNEDKLYTKMSYNLYVSNFKKILDIENDEYNNSDISQESEFIENREKQLEILNIKYTKLYESKERKYENIIKEIDIEKKLFYKGSIMTFNLLIIKIKCLMKLLKEKFQNSLKIKKDERINYELDIYTQKVKHEFIKIYSKINEESKYEYEIITQVYCKFLLIMAIISNKQEEFNRSFNLISLGVNMLKVFFIRQSIATDIETYNIFAKLLILLINKLIADNNINQSLIYINLLSKTCEIGLYFIYKKQLHKKYEYKFNKYNGYNFLFMGYCYELKKNNPNNNKIYLKAYKEAFYFMHKSKRFSLLSEGKIIIIENKALYLSKLLYEKSKENLIYEALEKQRKIEQQEKIKKKLIKEAKLKEKKYKLKLISCGLSPEPKNLVKMENRLYKVILTTTNQKLIDKLYYELISYVYKDKQIDNSRNKKDIKKIKNKNLNAKKNDINRKKGGLKKRLPSMDIMKNLCHYKIYNSLMSKDFKEFLLNNTKLEFNHPKKQKISLDKIQKFLNHKIEIDSNSENPNKEKEVYINMKSEVNINLDNKIKPTILKLKNDNQKKLSHLVEINKNDSRESNSSFIKNNSAKANPSFILNNKHSFVLSRNKNKDMNKKIHTTYSDYIESFANSNKSKLKSKSKLSYRGRLFNRQLDKYIFNKKYFEEYEHFDNLTNKELDFQKQFLESKKNNSKMFFKGYDTELSNNGKISRDDVYKSFLIINNEVSSKDRNLEKEIKNQIEKKNKPKMVGNVFKSVTNKIEGGKVVKDAMRKVLGKYVMEQKIRKTNKNLINVEEIKKKNENSIMKLNDNINEINNLLISKRNENKNNNAKLNNYLEYNDV